MGILLLVEFYFFHNIEINRYIVNSKDKDIILQIENKVKDYEKDTNQKVSKISFYNLDHCQKFYEGINDNINVSALKENPSGLALYSYYTNRALSYEENDKNIDYKYFYGKTYDSFSLDQVVIIGDTIHLYLN